MKLNVIERNGTRKYKQFWKGINFTVSFCCVFVLLFDQKKLGSKMRTSVTSLLFSGDKLPHEIDVASSKQSCIHSPVSFVSISRYLKAIHLSGWDA